MKKYLLITGPKHAGKTTAAAALAARLGRPCIDLDAFVQQRSGKTPRQLYLEGPAVFQAAEADALRSLFAQGDDTIIAAGGGLCDNEEALRVLREQADTTTVVYLEVSADTAWQRITAAGPLPPFLQTADPQSTHRALHERRAAQYRALAGIVIPACGQTPDAIAAAIAAAIVRAMVAHPETA